MTDKPDSSSAAPSLESLRQQISYALAPFPPDARAAWTFDNPHTRPYACLRDALAVLDHERSLVAEIQQYDKMRAGYMAKCEAEKAELRAEIQRLREENRQWEAHSKQKYGEIQRLTDALKKYGQHKPHCRLSQPVVWYREPPCECGFAAALPETPHEKSKP